MLDILLYYSLIFDSDNDVTIHIVTDKCVHLVQLKFTTKLLCIWYNVKETNIHPEGEIIHCPLSIVYSIIYLRQCDL